MININTINKLNSIGIGADIYKLESYVDLINYSNYLGRALLDKEEKEYVESLLKEVKSDSKVFKYSFGVENNPIGKMDKLITNNIVCVNELGINNEDLIGIGLPLGVDIRLIYVDGSYFGAFTYNNVNVRNKGKDITEYVRDLVPEYLGEKLNKGLVEIKAVISICNTDNIYNENLLDKIVEFLKNDYYLMMDNMHTIYAYEILRDNSKDEVNIWNDLQLLSDIGFESIYAGLIRDVQSVNTDKAVDELKRYFNNSKDKIIDEYDYNVHEIRLLKNTNNSVESIIKVNNDEIFEVSIIDYKVVHDKNGYNLNLIIKPLKLEDKVIHDINIYGIDNIDKVQSIIGKHVYIKYSKLFKKFKLVNY